jgi:hypothetical protein
MTKTPVGGSYDEDAGRKGAPGKNTQKGENQLEGSGEDG